MLNITNWLLFVCLFGIFAMGLNIDLYTNELTYPALVFFCKIMVMLLWCSYATVVLFSAEISKIKVIIGLVAFIYSLNIIF